MIRNLTGSVLEKSAQHVTLDVSGVGYLIHTPQTVTERLAEGDELSVWTHLSVKETALELYGFATKEELAFFEMLLGVSGVGPKSALSILSLAPAEELVSAIAGGDSDYLTRVSGIGKRGAAKIIVELKEKLQEHVGTQGETSQETSDATLALQALGYTTHEAREALRKMPDEIKEMSTNEQIKAALKHLSHS